MAWSAMDAYRAMSEEERQRRREEIHAGGWRVEDHQSALLQTASILRRVAEQKTQAS